MKYFQIIAFAAVACGTWLGNVCLAEDVLQSFAAYVQDSTHVGESKKEEVAKIIADYGNEAAADAITESLMVLYDGYEAAVEASDDDDALVAVGALEGFVKSDDRYLAADASFYLGRCLMNAERFESALPLLNSLHGELAPFNVHVGRAKFYTGVAEAGLLNYAQAIQTLEEFVDSYPDAPERLRVAAWRQLQQLNEIESGKLTDIYERMDFSRRKLSLNESDEKTQGEQAKIVNMLAKLIKEQEKKEASQNQSQNKDQKNTKKQQQDKKPQQKPSNQQKSSSQTGGSSNNASTKVVKKSYSNGPTSPWSRLRDRSRDPANSAIKDKFPARYRDIVERYYDAANGRSKR